MSKDIRSIRKDYTKGQLSEESLPDNPFHFFEKWLHTAKEETDKDYNAMVVSTVNEDGFPQSRIVLLRELRDSGLVFYTNYGSHKGNQIDQNPKAAINFFWKELERQVRVVGSIERLSAKDSDAYFSSRPRSSKIGAWASDQSSAIDHRGELEEKVAFYEKKFEGKEVPRPEHWGGYLLKPHYFEFWQGRASRLHDRMVYDKKESVWTQYRIQP